MIEIKDEALQSLKYIRCAKAALILHSLKSSTNRQLNTRTDDEHEEKDLMLKEIRDLKINLAKEKIKNKRIKLCCITEVILQILVPFSFSVAVLMLAFSIGLF